MTNKPGQHILHAELNGYAPMPAIPTPTGQELKKEMAKAPSLDEFFVRNPKTVDMQALMNRLRQDRAVFIAKGEMTRTNKDEE